MKNPPAPRKLGAETRHNDARRHAEGFYDRYLGGPNILDIGYRGGTPDAEPVVPQAIGIELDYPGYDGLHLPFEDGSQDAVFASHTLEHIKDWQHILADWFRVLRVGGYLIIAVPHRYLYERKASLPSRFNADHKRFYTPQSLLAEIETALPVACWRLRSLRDIDDGFSYETPPEQHPKGCYEIELVLQRIAAPAYQSRLVPSPLGREMVAFLGRLLNQAIEARNAGRNRELAEIQALLVTQPLPSIRLLEPLLPPAIGRAQLLPVMMPWIRQAPFDEEDYLRRHPDIRAAIEHGQYPSAHEHYVVAGYLAGRLALPVAEIFK